MIIHPQATEKIPITYPGKRREEKPSNNSQQNRSKQVHMPSMQTWIYAFLVHKGLI